MAVIATLPAPSPAVSLPVHPLTPAAFAPFGDVILRPSPTAIASQGLTVNQGTAIKHPLLSTLESTYPNTPVPRNGINLFVCRPRQLTPSGHFVCGVLERHPFTSQSFIPLAAAGGRVKYVVIVAPTGKNGMPVLEQMQAFEGSGDRGITYRKGVWHAPMVAIEGEGEGVQFVVVNAENGVPGMDCEEVNIKGGMKVRCGMGSGLWGSKL